MIYFEMKYETMKICIEEYIPRELKILFIQNGIFAFVIRWISGEFCNAFWLQIVRNAWEFVKKGLKLLSEPKITFSRFWVEERKTTDFEQICLSNA